MPLGLTCGYYTIPSDNTKCIAYMSFNLNGKSTNIHSFVFSSLC